ncbi:hypothetical protein C8T65DRAFT_751420 [Cerioporus squamosus]|nr:hypothetical protein C8T65DRAFT_751420 [Cerioporus squamosus]
MSATWHSAWLLHAVILLHRMTQVVSNQIRYLGLSLPCAEDGVDIWAALLENSIMATHTHGVVEGRLVCPSPDTSDPSQARRRLPPDSKLTAG